MRIVPILGVLASSNHPPWGYLLVMCPGGLFWVPFWGPLLEGLGSILGPKWGPESDFFGFRFWSFFGSSFYGFWGPFWSPKRPKRDQDYLQKQSKTATIPKRSDFEKVWFDMFLAGILEHQASQESPKTAKKNPKMAPGSLPDLSKTHSIFRPHFFEFRTMFWVPKWSPEEPKTGP